MTSYNINPTARSFDLVAEALHYLANKISALKEQEEQWQEQNEEEDIIIEEINDYVIAKDLDENAQRLEEIARDYIPLLSQTPFPVEAVVSYIDF